MIAPIHNAATFDMALSAKYNIQKWGSGLTVKSSQFHNNTEIATLFLYDGIQRPRYTINCEGDTTAYTYDMLDRQIEVKHPASGTTKLSYDLAGNLLTKQTANLTDKGTSVSEMAHASDANQGHLYPKSSYKNLNGDIYNPTYNGLFKSEWRAVYRENIIRSQAGVPLKTHYGVDMSKGSPIGSGPRLLTLSNLPINY